MACALLGLGVKTLLPPSCAATRAPVRIGSSRRLLHRRADTAAMTRRRQAAGGDDGAAAAAAAQQVADLLQRHEVDGTLPRCVVFDLDYTVSVRGLTQPARC